MNGTLFGDGNGAVAEENILGIFGVVDRLSRQAFDIEPALAARQFVLVDRYVNYTLAYYAVKHDSSLQYLASICSPIHEPDATSVLDCTSEVAIDRVVQSREC
ncbi:hypothetical protein AB0B45_33020 [Nonomuraea sp. NPDC049152]|uniref:hypothetical protein n=1 Tax=Nonomuraea sp. NPDC049152 TaxID=3154350 RepID=UPI003401F593